MSSDNLFTRATRAVKHDYHLLNDGSDDEANISDRIEPVPKRPYIVSDTASNQLIE